jgi:predicted CXXCH cytochrome family protein
MSIISKRRFIRFITLTITGLCLAAGTSKGVEQCLPPPTTDAQCIECHQPLVDQEMSKPYIHRPFREKKCLPCHLGGELFVPGTTPYRSDQNVAWLAESRFPSVEHWLTLPKERVAGNIFLDIKVPKQGVYRNIVEQYNLTDLPELALDQTPPIITEVKITNIARAVFWSATISWLTDELADTRIAYGTNKLDKTDYIAEMSRSHRITIAGLKGTTEYRFKVGSADYSGNLAGGEITTFSTTNTEEAIHPELPIPPAQKLNWDREIFQNSPSNSLILHVTTSGPTEVAAGVAKGSKPERSTPLTAGDKKKPCRHNLKTALETTITVCRPCHEPYFKGGTRHPLQVKPKAGKSFPKEFLVLADGGISCMTCHSAHSSIYPNRLIKSDKEQLCRGCHSEKYGDAR